MQSTIDPSNSRSMYSFQDQLSDHVQGIFWITGLAGSNDLPPELHCLDYFFEGVLASNFTKGRKSLPSVFFSKSFGKPFFLVKIPIAVINDKKALKEIFAIVEGIKRPEDCILVFEKESHSGLQYLSKSFPMYHFDSLLVD